MSARRYYYKEVLDEFQMYGTTGPWVKSIDAITDADYARDDGFDAGYAKAIEDAVQRVEALLAAQVAREEEAERDWALGFTTDPSYEGGVTTGLREAITAITGKPYSTTRSDEERRQALERGGQA